MKTALIIITLCCSFGLVKEPKVYKSLCEALKEPNKVYHLKLNTWESMQNCNLEEIKNLINLEILEISECPNIKSLPNEIAYLKSLKKVSFYWNGTGQQGEIDWNKEFKKLSQVDSLEYLKLGPYNVIEHLSPEIKGLKNLKVLDLRMTTTLSLPKEIGGLTRLEILDLSMTKIKELPKELANIKSLKKVYLVDTEISKDDDRKEKVKNLLKHCEVIFEPDK